MNLYYIYSFIYASFWKQTLTSNLSIICSSVVFSVFLSLLKTTNILLTTYFQKYISIKKEFITSDGTLPVIRFINIKGGEAIKDGIKS